MLLVNGNTIGFAEAVAAAIQDNRRGTVLGTKTPGAGRVDFTYDVLGMRIRVPTAFLARANGDPLDGRGVMPDGVDQPATPEPSRPLSDVACPNVASPSTVAGDPLIQRAASILLATDAS